MRKAQRYERRLAGVFLAVFMFMAVATAQLRAQVPLIRLPDFFEGSPVAMLLIEPADGKILAANHAAQSLYGWTSTEFRELFVHDLNQMSEDKIKRQMENARDGEQRYFLFPHRFKDGSIHTVRIFSWPIIFQQKTRLFSVIAEAENLHMGDEPLAAYSSNLEDAVRQTSAELKATDGLLNLTLISAIAVLLSIVIILAIVLIRGRKLVRALGRQHLLLRVVIDAIPDQIYFKRPDGTLEACNQAAAEFVGMPAELIVGKTDREIFGKSTDALLMQQVFSDVNNQGKLINQGEVTNPAGRKYTLEMIKAPVIDARGERLGSVSVWRDVTERRRTEARIEALAYYDPLTKLANRAKAQEVLLGFLATHRVNRQHMAIAIFDLDSFAAVNSIFGHNIGDALLKTTSRRLSDNIDAGSFTARLSSDEFVVFLTALGGEEDKARAAAHAKIEDLHACLSRQAFINGNQLTPSASAGAVLVSPSSEGADEELRRADLAMHNAKSRGRGSITWFHAEMVEDLVARFDVETALEKALQNGGLRLFLQPKIIEGAPGRHFEALLRLDHPERGIIGPGSFIHVAEATGLIVPIGAWVLEEACRMLARNPDLHLAVNVSVRQFLREKFVDDLALLLDQYQFEPERLTLEMTESLMIANFDLALSQLRKIRALNIRLSIDDFGTGYSALVYLKQFPLNELKIDKTFIAGVPHDSSDTSLVELIITMAHHLGISIIAEGVETREQEAWLRNQGCEGLQGFLFSPPQPASYYLNP
ncbi:sensor domain-containing phosphodiesterase [Martelella radicis]|uniref:Diguanylate cyclase (GGDEF)-like protein/PAS domain S-box-containing protein n=1 Tax=Martelella radicis TaxID=1397476 RepID=A0A7W6KLI6_9HYPH|nr:EAL domain-containing protein [Martelella radicis]MBB4123498.1 diguanylate cyclase (GGDEF)-like protein/PAS domain S-box-containing protein [Martelella radicis]